MGRSWGTLAVPVGAVSAMLAVGLAATVGPSRAMPVRVTFGAWHQTSHSRRVDGELIELDVIGGS